MGIKGIKGIKGFKDRIISERAKYTKSSTLVLPDGIKHGNYLPSTIVSVGKYGGEQFDNIQDALSSIKDAATDKWYVLNLSGGTYNENLTIPGYVVLQGSHVAQITGSLTFQGNAIVDSVIVNDTAAVIVTTSCELSFYDCDITGTWAVTDADITLRSSSISGNFTFQGDSAINIWDSLLTCAFSKTDAGVWDIAIINSRMLGYIYSEVATTQLSVTHSALRRLTVGNIIQLEAGVASSYIRLRHSTLQARTGSNTIGVSGGAGNLELWSGLNALSAGFHAQVNENIAITYNTTDVGFASL